MLGSNAAEWEQRIGLCCKKDEDILVKRIEACCV